MIDIISTPLAPYVQSSKSSIDDRTVSNINYLKDEIRYSISAKFYSSLPSSTNIPVFNPLRLEDWKDKMKSYLRSCYSLDLMLRDVRESTPIILENESVDEFEKRISIYNGRSRIYNGRCFNLLL